jgi:hypothetical protein
MESSLAKCFETIARQNEQLVTQAATLEQLFRAQTDPDEVQTSTHEVVDSILTKLGIGAQFAQRGKYRGLTSNRYLSLRDEGFSGSMGAHSKRSP